MADPLGKGDVLWQQRSRLKRVAKRRWRYLKNMFFEIFSTKRETLGKSVKDTSVELQAGDLVRVRSREEIQATLNRWNYLRGCGFMEEMWPYCNTTQRVLKRVERFLDERDYLIKKTRGVVLLEGLFCRGTVDYGSCDRMCFYFWRQEWLEKLDEA